MNHSYKDINDIQNEILKLLNDMILKDELSKRSNKLRKFWFILYSKNRFKIR